MKWIGCVRKEDHVIKFTSKDLYDVSLPHEDPLIVTLQIEKYQVQRILVDTRSSSNILFHHYFRSMYREHEELCLSQTLLVGFNRKTTHAVRQLMLEAVRGEVQVNTLFLIDGSISSYNAILGRPWIHTIAVVTSTYH